MDLGVLSDLHYANEVHEDSGDTDHEELPFHHHQTVWWTTVPAWGLPLSPCAWWSFPHEQGMADWPLPMDDGELSGHAFGLIQPHEAGPETRPAPSVHHGVPAGRHPDPTGPWRCMHLHHVPERTMIERIIRYSIQHKLVVGLGVLLFADRPRRAHDAPARGRGARYHQQPGAGDHHRTPPWPPLEVEQS